MDSICLFENGDHFALYMGAGRQEVLFAIGMPYNRHFSSQCALLLLSGVRSCTLIPVVVMNAVVFSNPYL